MTEDVLASIDADELRELVEAEPDAIRAFASDTPDCPVCGLPMVGAKTDEGPVCVRECGP